jgi:hypothetical protein
MRHEMMALCSAVLLLGGCYSYGLRKPDPPPIDAFGPVTAVGQVCVLRPHWIASAVTAVVHDNGELVGATRGPTYFCYRAQPGRHVITSKADSVEQATVEVAPGKHYYLHQIVDNIGGWVRTRLAWIDDLEAQRLVPKCGYRVLVSVPGDERLPSEEPAPAAAVAVGAAAR